MEKIPLVRDLVLWRFPELADMIAKQLSRAGTIKEADKGPGYLNVTIALPEKKLLLVYPDFDIYNKVNIEKTSDGILVDPDNWKVLNNRLPDIYFREEPKMGAHNVQLRIYLSKIIHRDEPHHVGKEFFESHFCWFSVSLMRGIYFLNPRK
jgi:hypothetical protein